MLPFLDEHLKGGPPADIARVTAFEAGANQWQRLDDWPQACARGCPANLTPLYLAPGRAAGLRRAGAAASDSYVSDPAQPVTYRARPNLPPFAPNSTWRHLAGRRPALRRGAGATSSPMRPRRSTQPLHLAGTPLVHLVASTSGSDSDWVVKLIDVYPDQYPQPELGGYELAIAMDIMRGRYRTDPAHPSPLPPNQPLTYEFALPTVDYVVQPGHRLMVQVQSSWFPLYDRNPQTFVPNIFFAKPATTAPPPSACSPAPAAVDRPARRQADLAPARAAGYLAPRPRSIAQLVEHRSPKPRVVGSSPSAPASRSERQLDVTRFTRMTAQS